MTTVRMKVLAFLTVFVTVCSIIAVAAFGGSGDINANGKLYIATTDEFDGMIRGEEDIPGADVMGSKRLSQNVTVTNENGTLSVGGTVIKNQDPFYPGTYIVSFSNNSILSSRAVVEVRMKVAKGDTVYVLVGDKEKGYSEYTSVVADRDNAISFETNVLQDYTLSTTDIIGAQEAMACVLSSESELLGD
ncbi:MAG: hypothetical protein E7305_06675 [Butyrivibrio sp.]|nr:hypothetical protein [Butyrivibrio sp.]